MSWWGVGKPVGAGLGYTWFVAEAPNWNAVQSKYPADIVEPYAFPTRQKAQTWVDQQNGEGKNPGGGGSAKPGKSRKPDRSRNGALIVSLARSWLGVPYQYGGTTRQGVDCSGLILNICQEAGLHDCPRTSEEQWTWVQHITANDSGPGDLVFFVGAEIDPPPGHVGVLINSSTMIDAPFTGTVVRYDHFADGPGPNKIIGYGRIPGIGKATTANPNYGTAQKGGTVAAGITGSTISVLAVILIVTVLFLLLIAAAILWRRH